MKLYNLFPLALFVLSVVAGIVGRPKPVLPEIGPPPPHVQPDPHSRPNPPDPPKPGFPGNLNFPPNSPPTGTTYKLKLHSVPDPNQEPPSAFQKPSKWGVSVNYKELPLNEESAMWKLILQKDLDEVRLYTNVKLKRNQNYILVLNETNAAYKDYHLRTIPISKNPPTNWTIHYAYEPGSGYVKVLQKGDQFVEPEPA